MIPTGGGRLFAISGGCRVRGEPEGHHLDTRRGVRPDRPHPLFYGFVKAAAEKAEYR